MLTCSGIVALVSEPKQTKSKYGTYFDCDVVSADPQQGKGYHHYKLNLYAQDNELDTVQKELVKGTVLQLRYGGWDGSKYQYEGKEGITNKIKTTWKHVSVINWMGKKNQ